MRFRVTQTVWAIWHFLLLFSNCEDFEKQTNHRLVVRVAHLFTTRRLIQLANCFNIFFATFYRPSEWQAKRPTPHKSPNHHSLRSRQDVRRETHQIHANLSTQSWSDFHTTFVRPFRGYFGQIIDQIESHIPIEFWNWPPWHAALRLTELC